MSYIITDDKYYKNIANSLRSKMLTDREYYPEDMAAAIDNIPSSADGTDNPITGIYFLNPNEKGYPTKIKVLGFSFENKETKFPLVFTDKIFDYIETVEFQNCDFKYFTDAFLKNHTNLKRIIIPYGVTEIANSAFYNCSSLTSINIPDSVTSIGGSAFYGCSSVIYVTLGNGFNANGLNLAATKQIERETMVNMFNALADRTGLTAYTLTLGSTNLAKMTEQDILIATNKNWTLA